MNKSFGTELICRISTDLYNSSEVKICQGRKDFNVCL